MGNGQAPNQLFEAKSNRSAQLAQRLGAFVFMGATSSVNETEADNSFSLSGKNTRIDQKC